MLTTETIEETDEWLLQQEFFARGWTDGLPIVVPTTARVEQFLQASGFEPERERSIGPLPPSQHEVTVERVALNALMAGCRPADLGVVLTALYCMLDTAFHLDILAVTTNPSAPLVVVSGPAVTDLGIACEDDALGPGRHPNGAIGRAVRLVMRNIGGAIEGVDHSTLGWPAKYTFCLGETPNSPWEPHHVSAGFDAAESVVTVIAVESCLNVIPHFHREDPLSLTFISQYVRAIQATGTNLMLSRGNPTVVLSPNHARRLLDEGIDRALLRNELFERSKIPLSVFPAGNLPVCDWTVEDGKVLPCASPDDILIIVAGGREGLHSTYMQAFGPCAATAATLLRPGQPSVRKPIEHRSKAAGP